MLVIIWLHFEFIEIDLVFASFWWYNSIVNINPKQILPFELKIESNS